MNLGLNSPLIGWIKPCSKSVDVSAHREQLQALGVEVGAWDMYEAEFVECRVSDEAFERLENLWGEYIWGLE